MKQVATCYFYTSLYKMKEAFWWRGMRSAWKLSWHPTSVQFGFFHIKLPPTYPWFIQTLDCVVDTNFIFFCKVVCGIAKLLYARQYNLQLVYLLPHFWSQFHCFQGGLFRKICPYVGLVIKSGSWWCAYGTLYHFSYH